MISRSRRRERGQTIVLVALSIVSLLAMAALSIDVVTLYTARSEVQRAADAAALAGAKAFVDSGVTSEPTNASLQTLAQSMGTAFINAILAQNKIGGVPPVLVGSPTFDFTTHPGNPQITVNLQRTGLPIFFARIWSRAPATVSASAKAEAYNASAGGNLPIAPKCVKPLLIPNQDPYRVVGGVGQPYITVATGTVDPGFAAGEGWQVAKSWQRGCSGGGGSTCGPPVVPLSTNGDYYFPAQVTPSASNLCPSCSGSSNFEQSLECCDFNFYSCGGTPPNPSVDTTITISNIRRDTRRGLRCLINHPNQDDLNSASLFPSGPLEIRANSGPQSGKLVTSSNSIVILPIFDEKTLNPATGQVTIIGFLQGFVWSVSGNGTFPMTILNVVACGTSPPVPTRGTSLIPVRLIH